MSSYGGPIETPNIDKITGRRRSYLGAAPHRFTGGTIKRVAIDVSGEPYVDLEREAATAMLRQ
jgi:hypothetical protein